VIKDQSCESLPLPLCVANLLVSAQWFLYGILVGDPYIKVSRVGKRHFTYLTFSDAQLDRHLSITHSTVAVSSLPTKTYRVRQMKMRDNRFVSLDERTLPLLIECLVS
jgi:hypothetical protein